MPIENSIEGSVRGTLDTLAFEAEAVTIVGEHDYAVRVHLIAREGVELERVEAVLSHPQPLAQCARFLRENLPGVEQRGVSSTAAAVRMVSESARPWAALGARAAAELYGCEMLREGVEDEADNVTRFVWIAPEGTEPAGGGAWKTSLVFSELGEDHPGALVEALQRVLQPRDQPVPDRVAAAAPGARPLHVLLRSRGRRATTPAVAEAIAALRTKADSVRILGSYPSASAGDPHPAAERPYNSRQHGQGSGTQCDV